MAAGVGGPLGGFGPGSAAKSRAASGPAWDKESAVETPLRNHCTALSYLFLSPLPSALCLARSGAERQSFLSLAARFDCHSRAHTMAGRFVRASKYRMCSSATAPAMLTATDPMSPQATSLARAPRRHVSFDIFLSISFFIYTYKDPTTPTNTAHRSNATITSASPKTPGTPT